ncbi:MAG: LysM peptidoglycan-binding domain-containing protein [Lachnospiraceae bacterium]|nr:LysM peptidoglycan-binding domain-containing protein [Lachnospiraceae bacterium]
MAYDIYMDKVLLPVAPSEIKTKIKNKNKTIELINEGEVNMLKSAGLTELSFSLLLPNQKYPFARYTEGFQNAAYYLKIFEEYKTNKKPFQFIIARMLPTGSVLFYTNIKVSLEDYNIEDSANEGFDIKVTLNLKQYKEYGTKTANVSAYIRPKVMTGTIRNNGAGANTSGTSYKIVGGDTLYNIAKKKKGDGSFWPTIYNANKTVIENAAKAHGRASSSNGHWIYPGTVIIIP